MLFSSIPFLYYFLPVVLLLYLIAPKKKSLFFGNLVLLGASLFFYYWGEPKYVYLMAASILLGYLSGLWIAYARNQSVKKAVLIAYSALVLGALGYFKYTGFFTENLNAIFQSVPIAKIALPIGISFYTFQILSYAIDVYRGTTPVQKDPVAFGAYISMFPQLIAGPIVRYSDIAPQLTERKTSLRDVQDGFAFFLIGLSKKVLLANQLGEFCEIFRASDEKSFVFYWVYAIAYTMHVYFDFSGYSDMAIGLGRIFGFRFMRNFNYPFISRSITEFWRRWHISLGTWFRDYVYIPLGGNRVKPARHILNIFIVWALTGFWHGAAWNFVLWGLFYAILLIAEKLIDLKRLEKLPATLRHTGVLFLTALGFVLFASDSLPQAGNDIRCLLGGGKLPFCTAETLYYLQSFAVVILISAFASTPLFIRCKDRVMQTATGERVISLLRPVVLLALLILCTAYLVDGSFNPFLYFRF